MTQAANDQSSMRLNKHLALQLGVSRREADDLIDAGKVKVNGEIASLGKRIAETDAVTLNGKPVGREAELSYALLNKPIGYVCSRRRQGDSPTVYELIPDSMRHLKLVGRLDRDSSGLILLTNDGDFAYKMTHPSFQKTKIYKVRLNQDLQPLHQQMISDYGVQLEDGPSKIGLERLHEGNSREWTVIMSEGRNRQIRRTFSALGYTVVKLHRTHFGKYALDDIKSGNYTFLNTQ